MSKVYVTHRLSGKYFSKAQNRTQMTLAVLYFPRISQRSVEPSALYVLRCLSRRRYYWACRDNQGQSRIMSNHFTFCLTPKPPSHSSQISYIFRNFELYANEYDLIWLFRRCKIHYMSIKCFFLYIDEN